MTETELIKKRWTTPLLKRWPVLYIEKVPSGPFKKGFPDVVMSYFGKAVVMEAKKEDNSLLPTKLQMDHLNRVHDSGGIALCLIFLKPNHKLMVLKARSLSNAVRDIAGVIGATVQIVDPTWI